MKKEIKHIHMIGICGTGMASLAGLLKEDGYKVTGSDSNAYPPMSTQLREIGINPKRGYGPENLNPKPDLVVIGNVVRVTNPEVTEVIDRGIEYLSMPEAISTFFLEGKKPIVTTGTHGKTTTSNIVAWLLEYLGEDPGFIIGGVGLNFGKSYKLGSGDYFVLEGDEYDTAFFDKGPKFLHYKPYYGIIGSIEFDHADIYNNLDEIKTSFVRFINLIPENGVCVGSTDSPASSEILKKGKCITKGVGYSNMADYRIDNIRLNNNSTTFCLITGNEKMEFDLPLFGKHNISNAGSAISLLLEAGFDKNDLKKGLLEFKGVRRRQEIRGEVDSIVVIDDFAHHPTSIEETLASIRSRFKERRIWAIFEPRSNTTRRKVFEEKLPTSFKDADIAIISEVHNMDSIEEDDRLNVDYVVSNMEKLGIKSFYMKNADQISDYVSENARKGDIVLIMSNGSFDNIHEKILHKLNRQ